MQAFLWERREIQKREEEGKEREGREVGKPVTGDTHRETLFTRDPEEDEENDKEEEQDEGVQFLCGGRTAGLILVEAFRSSLQELVEVSACVRRED